MRISTNYQSLVTQRRLKQVVAEEEKAQTRLSSGNRIYRSALDPAGLAIATGLQAKNTSNLQAQRNINDGISLLQVAEGTLSVLHEIGGRMRELAMQSATDTIGIEERFIIDKEFQQMKLEMKRLVSSTKFNGNHIINGQGSVYELQVGVGHEAKSNRLKYDLQDILNSADNFGIGSSDLLTKAGARGSFSLIDGLIEEVSKSRAKLGGSMNRMSSGLQSLKIGHENGEATRSRITDADVAIQTAERARTSLIKESAVANLVNANIAPGKITKLIS